MITPPDYKDYLGDGVYVEVDCGMIRLWTQREHGVHEIFLEPEVMQDFLIWYEQFKETDKLVP